MTMSTINTGGAAFPMSAGTGHAGDNNVGMSLRDFFVAHAPAEPQAWFKPTLPPKPQIPADMNWCENCRDGVDACTTPAVCDGMRGILRAKTEWEHEEAKQHLIQWPSAWADEMLKARGAKESVVLTKEEVVGYAGRSERVPVGSLVTIPAYEYEVLRQIQFYALHGRTHETLIGWLSVLKKIDDGEVLP